MWLIRPAYPNDGQTEKYKAFGQYPDLMQEERIELSVFTLGDLIYSQMLHNQ